MITPTKEWVETFKKIPGALSVTEAIGLLQIAQHIPGGRWLELGSHRGKSAFAAGSFSLGKDDLFELVDPIYEDEKIVAEVTGYLNNYFTPIFIAAYSTDIIENYNELAYCFLDSGDHSEDLVQAEIKLLEDRIMQGGVLAFHDFDNQFTAVRRGYDQLVKTGKYEPIHIDWKPIVEYVKENNLEDGNNSWHIYEDVPYPNFVGAIKRK